MDTSPSPSPESDFGKDMARSPPPVTKLFFEMDKTPSPPSRQKSFFGMDKTPSPPSRPKFFFGMDKMPFPPSRPKKDLCFDTTPLSPQEKHDFGMGTTPFSSREPQGCGTMALPQTEDIAVIASPVPEKIPSKTGTYWPKEAKKPFGSLSEAPQSEFHITCSYILLLWFMQLINCANQYHILQTVRSVSIAKLKKSSV
jgi:hypothetical protein